MHVAFTDPDAKALAFARKELGVDGEADFHKGLSLQRPDIVFVCSPTKLHLEQAREAAKNGMHLFIEKPLSNSLDGVDELRKIVTEKKLICMVGCNMRFHFGPATVKRMIEEGAIGKVLHAGVYTGSYLPDWRPQNDYKKSYSADPTQGGAILDCIHEIDLALWYLGAAKLAGVTKEQADILGIPVEGTADLRLEHASGATSDVHLSFMEKQYKRFCVIEGEEGSISWDIDQKTVEVTDAEGYVVQTALEPAGYDLNRMYIDEITHFLECVASGRPSEGNLDEATMALSLALEARNMKKA